MVITPQGPNADVILTAPSDPLTQFYLYSVQDIIVSLADGGYFINGYWRRRETVPEPGAMALLAIGLTGLVLFRRSKRT